MNKLKKGALILWVSALAIQISPASDVMTGDYQWKAPGYQYVDPTSFFSLHGYVDGIFGSTSRQWTAADPAQIGAPGQLLVPNSNRSGFQYDAALFIGSEISEITRLVTEIHFVSDPSGTGAAGPGGITVAFTEANVSWDLVPQALTLSAGLFWNPFGLVGQDWLGAQNLFTLIPRASGAFPSHFNERGVRFNGVKVFSEKTAINYVASVGNGVQTFDISGQTSTDQNNNKTTTLRVGVFPGLGDKLDIGFSYARGQLRENLDLTKLVTDPTRYPANFHAYGLDVVLKCGGFKSRSYVIASKEELESDPGLTNNPPDLTRVGAMTELLYPITFNEIFFGIDKVVPKVRFDWVDFEALNSTGLGANSNRSAVTSFGVNIHPEEHVYLSLEFHVQDELSRPELANNRFVARLTGEF